MNLPGTKKKNKLLRVAKSYGWRKLKSRYPWEVMLTVGRDGVELDAWTEKIGPMITVHTFLNHPKKGHTALWRDKLTPSQFKRVLINPRAHTGRGVYLKDVEPSE